MKQISLLLAVLVSLSSCSTKTLFTQEHRNDIENYEIPLDRIQIFTQSLIVLKRLESATESDLSNGTLKVKSQTLRKIIKFNAKTKGVIVAQKSDGVKVQFEPGENRELEFVINRDGWYKLATNNGIVEYEGQDFSIIEGQNTLLLFDKRLLTKTKTKRRTVKGMRVKS